MFMRGGSSGTGLQADLDARLAASGVGNGGAIAEGYARTPAQQAAAGLDNSNFDNPLRVTKADNTDFSNPKKASPAVPAASGSKKDMWIGILNAIAMAKAGESAGEAKAAALSEDQKMLAGQAVGQNPLPNLAKNRTLTNRYGY